jgi:predicted unusual protein kinase regulating ubiquinone biosynthesis (AarF/ABC1/UbiB family)
MTSKKSNKMQRNGMLRGLTVSLAGARTGGAMLADGALNKLLPGRQSNSLLEKEAQRFSAELGRLKGTYTKIGQMLALLGEHFLPVEMTEALHKLESQTIPLDWSDIEPVLQQRLGDRYSLLEIDQTALAAASMAQVHRAVIKASGEQLCLKILYPGVQDTIDSDFNTVIRMLKYSRLVKMSRELIQWLETIRQQLHKEVDYPLEITMTETMAGLLAEDPRYKVPKVYQQFCSEQLIALEYIDGVNVCSVEVSRLPLKRRNRLAESMLDLFFHEVYQWGLVQTDPNFGNYLITSDSERDQIVLLDFGSVMKTPASFNQALGATIQAGQMEDRIGVIEGLIQLGCLTPESSSTARETFADFCLQLLEPLRDLDQLPAAMLNQTGEYRWGHSDLLKRVGKSAAKSTVNRDFSLPTQEFAFIARKLTGVFTFIAVLEAEFNGAPLLLRHKPSLAEA